MKLVSISFTTLILCVDSFLTSLLTSKWRKSLISVTLMNLILSLRNSLMHVICLCFDCCWGTTVTLINYNHDISTTSILFPDIALLVFISKWFFILIIIILPIICIHKNKRYFTLMLQWGCYLKSNHGYIIHKLH